jgi:hypothetical protein
MVEGVIPATRHSSIDKIRAELVWVNETPEQLKKWISCSVAPQQAILENR